MMTGRLLVLALKKKGLAEKSALPIFSNLCILMPSEELNYSWLVNWADYHFFVPQIEADNSNLCVRTKMFEGYKNILSGEIFSNFE